MTGFLKVFYMSEGIFLKTHRILCLRMGGKYGKIVEKEFRRKPEKERVLRLCPFPE
jgi:hypothetical protein